MDPIVAFCSSDEETNEAGVLQFLPISPEVEEPEEGGPYVPPPPPTSSPPLSHKYHSYDINLEGSFTDGKLTKHKRIVQVNALFILVYKIKINK